MEMMRDQSWFWSIGGLVMSGAYTAVVVINPAPEEIAYGIGELLCRFDVFVLTITRMRCSGSVSRDLGRYHSILLNAAYLVACQPR
jgi:hypothetical protein